MAADGDDNVGYCRPPKKHQFRKGTSGNPKGRPKGSPNLVTAVRSALAESVVVTEGGRRKTISKLDAAAIQMANKAASGDPRAFQVLVMLRELLEGPPNKAAALSVDDQKVMADVTRRIREGKPDLEKGK